MFKDYYKRELGLLRETATLFAEENPTIAGSLRNVSSDPDVQRLLEGFAFLSANLHQELDDHYPRLLHTLAQIVSPQYLRPLPSTTLIEFKPKPSLQQMIKVKRGAHLDGTPRAGSSKSGLCRFRTCAEVEVRPLKIARIYFQESESGTTGNSAVTLVVRFEIQNTSLSQLQMDTLRLHLSGSFADASDLMHLLQYNLNSIDIRSTQGEVLYSLGREACTQSGFKPEEGLLNDRPRQLPAFEMLREYFLFPEKFLFLNLDLSAWQQRPELSVFEVAFRCKKAVAELPRLSSDSLLLHVAPAVNLFPLEADSMVMTQRDAAIRVTPAAQGGFELARNARVYSVDSVEGIVFGRNGRRKFQPLSGGNLESPHVPRYVVHTSVQEALGKSETWVIPVVPPQEALHEREVLKIDLTCNNGDGVEHLQRGDICISTGESPELVTFSNLSIPTKNMKQASDGDLMWSLMSDLNINYASLADLGAFKAMLKHYLPGQANEDARISAAIRRIESIEGIHITPDQTLFRDAFIRGQRIRLKVRGDYFSGEGDKYLFGCVVDYLFASLCGFNTFTALEIEDMLSGALMTWPVRLGTKTLL